MKGNSKEATKEITSEPAENRTSRLFLWHQRLVRFEGLAPPGSLVHPKTGYSSPNLMRSRSHFWVFFCYGKIWPTWRSLECTPKGARRQERDVGGCHTFWTLLETVFKGRSLEDPFWASFEENQHESLDSAHSHLGVLLHQEPLGGHHHGDVCLPTIDKPSTGNP